MREIKFRGKSVESGEWVYGGFFESGGKSYIVLGDAAVVGGAMFNDLLADFTEIDPKTVGQYTGLKDKNGKEIYEGDILRNPYDRVIVAWWSTLGACFLLVWDEDYRDIQGKDPRTSEGNPVGVDGFEDVDFCEIIGNIHDNPELLQENNES